MPATTVSTALRQRTVLYWTLCVTVFLFALPTFWFLAFRVNSDFHHHARFIAGFIREGNVPLDFLYFGSVALLSGFSTELTALLWASVVVLSVALTAKFLVTVTCLGRSLQIDPIRVPREFDRLGPVALGLLLLFCFPLPGMNWYLGQFPPNVWHNSTTIAIMPFAVLLFYHSARFLESGETRRLLPTTVYTVLGFLAKPSLFFTFGVVFPVFSLLRFGFGKRFVKSCLPVALGGVLLLGYVLLMYFSPLYTTGVAGWQPALGLGWFDVWRQHSSNIPLSIANSLLLPALFFVGYPRRFLADLQIRYALAMLAFGLILFSVVQETGEWSSSGNLLWQNIICNYLLHFAVVVAFIRIKLVERRFRGYDYFLVTAFSAEATVGLLYVVKIFLTRDYF
jgi:hypothetical protein